MRKRTKKTPEKEELENNQEQESKKTPKKGKKLTPKEEIQQLIQQNEELKDKYLRLFAEFDNYKKRTVREKLDLMQTASRDILTAILPVLDDFDRMSKNEVNAENFESFVEGVTLVQNKFNNTVTQKGLKAMETEGEVFDPELHEAFAEIPAPDESMKGKIVDTIERGFYLKDTIIRHAKVVVGK